MDIFSITAGAAAVRHQNAEAKAKLKEFRFCDLGFWLPKKMSANVGYGRMLRKLEEEKDKSGSRSRLELRTVDGKRDVCIDQTKLAKILKKLPTNAGPGRIFLRHWAE